MSGSRSRRSPPQPIADDHDLVLPWLIVSGTHRPSSFGETPMVPKKSPVIRAPPNTSARPAL